MVAAKMLVEKGAKVILGARREDKLEALSKKLGEENVAYQAMDVTDKNQVHSLAQLGIKKFNQIDALVNNAGIMPLSLLNSGRTDEWDQMIDTNIKGVLYGIDATLNHMLERGDGIIVNISSVAGLKVFEGSTVYSGTKYAVRAISEGLRMETAGKIQVTCIYPGAFQTELGTSIKDTSMLERLMKSGFGEIAQPAERVAESIVFALQQEKDVAVNEIVIRPKVQSA
jgi:NADP-dependent 3-hydroxy acid dehydrogenase YdfG